MLFLDFDLQMMKFFTKKVDKYIYYIHIGSKMNFHSYSINKMSSVFHIPDSLVRRGDIRHMSFINTVWNENSFQIKHVKLTKNARK